MGTAALLDAMRERDARLLLAAALAVLAGAALLRSITWVLDAVIFTATQGKGIFPGYPSLLPLAMAELADLLLLLAVVGIAVVLFTWSQPQERRWTLLAGVVLLALWKAWDTRPAYIEQGIFMTGSEWVAVLLLGAASVLLVFPVRAAMPLAFLAAFGPYASRWVGWKGFEAYHAAGGGDANVWPYFAFAAAIHAAGSILLGLVLADAARRVVGPALAARPREEKEKEPA